MDRMAYLDQRNKRGGGETPSDTYLQNAELFGGQYISPEAMAGIRNTEETASAARDVARIHAGAETDVADKYAGAKRYGSELEALPREHFNYNLSRAAGGPVGRRPYLVGEKGPELMVPDQPGTVIPNHKLQAMVRRAIPRADGGRVETIKGLDRGQVNLAGIPVVTPYMERRNQASLAAAGRFRDAAANVGTAPEPESSRARAVFQNKLLSDHGVKDEAGNLLPFKAQPAWLHNAFVQHAPNTMAELPDAITKAGAGIDTPKHLHLFNDPTVGPATRAKVIENMTKQAQAQGSGLDPAMKQRIMSEPVTEANIGAYKNYLNPTPTAPATPGAAMVPAVPTGPTGFQKAVENPIGVSLSAIGRAGAGFGKAFTEQDALTPAP